MNELFLFLICLVAPTAFSIVVPSLVPDALASLAACYDFRMDFQARSRINTGFTRQGEGCHRCSPKASPILRTCNSFTQPTFSSRSWMLACTPGYHLGYFFLCSFQPLQDITHCHIITSDSYVDDLWSPLPEPQASLLSLPKLNFGESIWEEVARVWGKVCQGNGDHDV